jgi:cardiolipin synthase
MKKKSGFFASVLVVAHVIGFFTSIRAVMEVRTSQGAIAWAISLNTFPVISVPAYWIFGNSRFEGYVKARREDVIESQPLMRQLAEDMRCFLLEDAEYSERALLLERLAKIPFTTGNDTRLLIDGEETFDAIFEGIASAEDYVLVQFYILRDDGLGTRLQQALMGKAAEGVHCYVIYDEIGNVPGREYRRALEDAGVRILPFNTRQGRGNRFQLNFRNHRKIVVVDGKVAWVGGHNVGDEYLGLDPRHSPWRDTHVELRGPVVQCVQLSFVEDWNWAAREVLADLNWTPTEAPGGTVTALSLPTGPADTFETATLFFLHVINEARDRLWIASPYFVPDEQIVSALQSAALRGVDVRVLIPDNPDMLLVDLSGYSYLPELEPAGVRVFRHLPGFMHQKVVLIDDETAAVGTANFDNRSFRLNFEITIVMVDKAFALEVERMLLEDLSDSREAFASDFTERSFPFRLAVRVSRLMAPLQ